MRVRESHVWHDLGGGERELIVFCVKEGIYVMENQNCGFLHGCECVGMSRSSVGPRSLLVLHGRLCWQDLQGDMIDGDGPTEDEAQSLGVERVSAKLPAKMLKSRASWRQDSDTRTVWWWSKADALWGDGRQFEKVDG